MGTGNFAVAIDRTEPVVVMATSGEMDAATVNRLDAAIDTAIADHDGHVIIDTNRVTFIDSTGITALVSGLRRLNRSRRRLALVVESGGTVCRALEVTGLDHTFECHPTADDAIAELADAPLIGR